MIIDCIADLHGFPPELGKGDLLIVAGDLTSRDEVQQHFAIWDWLCNQNYKNIIVIAGNHDNFLQSLDGHRVISNWSKRLTYLCDSGSEFEGFKIWGSPWTRAFKGMSPKAKAFTCETEEELAEKWSMIPDDVDILVTHSSLYGIHDEIKNKTKNVGSPSLARWCLNHVKPLKLHVCGHVHEGGGKKFLLKSQMETPSRNTWFVNASHVNEHYEPINKPVRVVL